MKLKSISPSTREGKKYDAVFMIDGKEKKVSFGLAGSSTFIDHADLEKREAYLSRHKVLENWENPLSAGSLSRYILWGDSSNIIKNIRAFKKRFNL